MLRAWVMIESALTASPPRTLESLFSRHGKSTGHCLPVSPNFPTDTVFLALFSKQYAGLLKLNSLAQAIVATLQQL